MSTTLRDIAERASVSASTVSRVLNNYPYVDDKTRQTVLEAAEALGYPRTNLRKSTGALRTVLLLVRLQQQGSEPNGDR
ncbi:MAG: LacI family DNA-binding transcriptional regulator, partial [Caldilineaceae bacterium]|nr:LacI family DNA-binding transcriptional regulator [Caldilineaceae bacterium]